MSERGFGGPDPYDDDPYDSGPPTQTDPMVGQRIGALEKAVEQLLATVGQIVERRESDGQQAPWCVHQPPDLEEDDDSDGLDPLDRWVEWANQIYRHQNWEPERLLVPVCWRVHPGLAAEVATLMWTWQRAFVDAAATADAAQNWHDRWLPGYLGRLSSWVDSGCLKGSCRRQRAHGTAASPAPTTKTVSS